MRSDLGQGYLLGFLARHLAAEQAAVFEDEFDDIS